METDNLTRGEILAAKRRRLKLGQIAASRLLGIGLSTVVDIERGKLSLTDADFERFSNIYDAATAED